MFSHPKTIATVVNYTCKHFIELTPESTKVRHMWILISHIELSLENKTRVDKHEKLLRPPEWNLDKNHELI